MTPATASVLQALHPLFVAFSFFMGASIGSFLNVVIYRVPHGMSVRKPARSFCPSCKNQIAWYDNIPLVSWIVLRGKCRHCGSGIAFRYFMVEFVTAVMFLAIYAVYGVSAETLSFWVFASFLIALTFIDIKHFILPFGMTYPLIALGILASPFVKSPTVVESLIGAAAGWLIIVGIAYIWVLLTKREGMGMGDAPLFGAIGAFLGYQSLYFVIMAASIQGLVVGVLLLAFGKLHDVRDIDDFDPMLNQNTEDPNAEENETPAEANNASEDAAAAEEEERERFIPAVPFGPFLALGALEYMLVGTWVLPWLHDKILSIGAMVFGG